MADPFFQYTKLHCRVSVELESRACKRLGRGGGGCEEEGKVYISCLANSGTPHSSNGHIPLLLVTSVPTECGLSLIFRHNGPVKDRVLRVTLILLFFPGYPTGLATRVAS